MHQTQRNILAVLIKNRLENCAIKQTNVPQITNELKDNRKCQHNHIDRINIRMKMYFKMQKNGTLHMDTRRDFVCNEDTQKTT